MTPRNSLSVSAYPMLSSASSASAPRMAHTARPEPTPLTGAFEQGCGAEHLDAHRRQRATGRSDAEYRLVGARGCGGRGSAGVDEHEVCLRQLAAKRWGCRAYDRGRNVAGCPRAPIGEERLHGEGGHD